jgi:predicted O-methyltransferase YrrM
MKKLDAKEFVNSLNVTVPSEEELNKFSDSWGALHQNSQGKVERHVYERGLYLYALVAKYKPKNILEIGTGGCYSAMCMAWAMEDHNIDGTIFTMDRFPPDKILKRFVDNNDGHGVHIENLSNNEALQTKADPNLARHIKIITGYSGEAFSKNKIPKVDFVLIDGGHHYEAVRHDFYSVLDVAGEQCGIIFDDYIDRPHYGVKKFVDEEILENFETYLINNGEITIKPDGTKSDHGAIWIQLESSSKPLDELFLKKKCKEIISKYRRYESLIVKPRQKLNQKFPYLEKIKFRWWKK